MSGRKRNRIWRWLLTAVVVMGLLPGAVRAEGTTVMKRVLSPEDVTDGSYVLIVSGQAAGGLTAEGTYAAAVPVMEDGRPVSTPEILWTLTKTEDGITLTDPAGNALPGLWTAECDNMLFRFSSVAEGQTAVFGYSGGTFSVTDAGQEGVRTEFSLFRQTEAELVTAPAEEDTPPVTGLYFGLLHAHTDLSDGTGTVAEVFARGAEEMDFLAVTDHSNSLTAEAWSLGKETAESVTSEHFVGLFGYEMSWPKDKLLGHISAFDTENFLSWKEDAYSGYASGLENYYAALAEQEDAFAQFQHPGTFWGDFKGFAYHEGADDVISLLEVACEGEDYSGAYAAALDKGWHVAPTFGGNTHNILSGVGTGRTAVLMDSLSPENLKDALKNRRTYATEDGDLHILYTLDEFEMGDIVSLRQVGPTAEIDVTLYDPTDTNIGTLEVIGPGGTVDESVPVTANPERITLSLPSDRDYWYLRVTQPDGDTAITAPVWIVQTEEVGISDLTASPSVPVQGSPVELTVTLFNEDAAALEVTAVELLVDGKSAGKWEEPFRVESGTTIKKQFSYTHEQLGEAELTLRVTAVLDGQSRNYEKNLLLSFRRPDMVTGILVDGTHANAGTDSLTELKKLAAERNMQLTIARETITEEMLGGCALLILSSPGEPFSDAFLETVREYVVFGGSLLVCADDPAQAGELNRLLAAVGATMYFSDELPEHRPQEFNRTDSLCEGINENQVFYMKRGCTVESGSGTWLVRGQDILAAKETVSGGGTILAWGSLLTEDAAVKEPDYLWEESYANRTIVQALLGIQETPVALSNIRQARDGTQGEAYRIRGYVTASTFPGMLVLQDSTGGMGIAPVRETIGLGKAVEITGSLDWQEGEPVLKPISVRVLEHSGHRYQPRSLTCKEAQNGGTYSGELVQVAGICDDRTLADNGTLRSFVLKDSTGKKLTVVIGETIVASGTGKNTLHTFVKEGEEIWAVGILQTDETGKTFLRIRNCAEVVAVEPIPFTGDGIALWLTALLLSGLVLLGIRKRKTTR